MNKIFTFELFLESALKSKSPLYFSARFREILEKLVKEKDPIAIFLKMSENTEKVQDDITFIDITEKEDMISFIQVNRLNRFRENDKNFYKKIIYYSEDKYDLTPIPELDNYIKKVWKATQGHLEHEGWKKQRTEIGIGRFVNRIASLKSITIKSEQLEKFVNSYKSVWKQLHDIEGKFELVSGEEIRKWYLLENYEEPKGQLFSSCMKYKSCQPYFDIYTLNPEVCQLLILKGKDPDKISGRALIWKTTSGDFYMDRPYTNNDSDINLYQLYANEKGWIYFNGIHEVKVKKIDYQYFPYMDSFKVYNPSTGILSTNEGLWPYKGLLKLENTDGGYKSGDDVVYSKTLDDYISRSLAVWVEDIDDYIYEEDAIYVESEDAYYSDENDDIVYCDWADVNEFQERCVYSTYLNSWLIKDDSKEVWVDRYKEEWVPKTARRYLSAVVEIDGEKKDCLVSSIVQDENGKWQFKN